MIGSGALQIYEGEELLATSRFYCEPIGSMPELKELKEVPIQARCSAISSSEGWFSARFERRIVRKPCFFHQFSMDVPCCSINFGPKGRSEPGMST